MDGCGSAGKIHFWASARVDAIEAVTIADEDGQNGVNKSSREEVWLRDDERFVLWSR
jgi:hypothetical protein